MALQWLDGFESYGVTNGNTAIGALNKYTNSLGTLTVRAGRLTGHSLSGNSSVVMTTPAFTANDTWIVGFAYYYIKTTNIEEPVFQLIDGSTVQSSVNLQPNGELQARKSSGGTSLGFTTGARIRAGVWNYIEIKIKVHASTGTVDIKVNGVSVMSVTGKNTDQAASSQATKVALCGATSTNQSTFDDFYVCDKGGSDNNTFLGPQKVTTIFATGDHGTNQWTPNSGSNHYDRVNENPHDTNTSYVSDAATLPGDIEEWDYADTGSEITAIKGIMVNTVFENDLVTLHHLINHVKSNGTTSDDAGNSGQNGTYITSSYLLEDDPHTAALWTKTNLDAALFGVKAGA